MTLLEIKNEILSLKAQKSVIDSDIKILENEIATKVNTKDEGTDHAIIGNHKVTVTNKLNRKLDFKAYSKLEDTLPEGVRCVDYKPTINMKKLRALEMLDMNLVAQFITTSPAKPSVKIEIVVEK